MKHYADQKKSLPKYQFYFEAYHRMLYIVTITTIQFLHSVLQ